MRVICWQTSLTKCILCAGTPDSPNLARIVKTIRSTRLSGNHMSSSQHHKWEVGASIKCPMFTGVHVDIDALTYASALRSVIVIRHQCLQLGLGHETLHSPCYFVLRSLMLINKDQACCRCWGKVDLAARRDEHWLLPLQCP